MNTSGSKQTLQHDRLRTHEQGERSIERVEKKAMRSDEIIQPQAAPQTNVLQQEMNVRQTPSETIGKDDFLLQQIDEFRNKAKQLQELVNKKENKVQQLQTIVSEKENRAEKLQSILTKRQSEADNILKDFETKVQVLIDNVQACITTMNREVKEQIKVSGQHTGEQMEEKLTNEIDKLKTQLEEQMGAQMPEIEKLSARIDAQMAETEQLLLQAKQDGQMANQQLREAVESSVQQLQEQSRQIAESMQEQSRQAAEQMQGQSQQAIQQMREQSAQTFQKMQEQTHKLTQQLQENTEKTSARIEKETAKNAQELQKSLAEMQEVMKTLENRMEENEKKNDSVKNELSEKIHSETVNCYRNLQTLFDQTNKKIEELGNVEQKIRGIKGYSKFTTWFSALTFLLLLMYIIFSAGLFTF